VRGRRVSSTIIGGALARERRENEPWQGETVVVGDAQLLGRAIDDPEAYIPSDRRRALAPGDELPDRVEGAALFADISGFTPLIPRRSPASWVSSAARRS